jgi:D-lactate dehydrogenase
MLAQADILSLHCPLLPETTHLINAQTLARMKRGVMLINTSRGRLIDTQAVIDAIKSGQVGAVGLDVYEEEEGIFFEDWSSRIVTDDVLMRLTTFPNVVVTSHQAFFTREALSNIAATTMANIREFRTKGSCTHAVHAQG